MIRNTLDNDVLLCQLQTKVVEVLAAGHQVFSDDGNDLFDMSLYGRDIGTLITDSLNVLPMNLQAQDGNRSRSRSKISESSKSTGKIVLLQLLRVGKQQYIAIYITSHTMSYLSTLTFNLVDVDRS